MKIKYWTEQKSNEIYRFAFIYEFVSHWAVDDIPYPIFRIDEEQTNMGANECACPCVADDILAVVAAADVLLLLLLVGWLSDQIEYQMAKRLLHPM